MSAKNTNLLMTIIKYGLGGIGVVLSLLLFGAPNVSEGTEAVEAYREGPQMSYAIWYTIILMFALLAIVVVFFLVQLITDTKKTVIAIAGIMVSLVIYLICLSAGTQDTTDTLLLKNPVSQGIVNTTTAGIWTIMVGMLIGALVIIAGPFMGRFRK
jgi:uncharacterized membrane protein